MPIFLAFVLFISSAFTVRASETALPGSPLYAVKTAVEQIHSTTAVTAQERADWSTQLAARRLSETEELSANGSLNSGQTNELVGHYERAVASARAAIDSLTAVGDVSAATELSARLNAVIDAHRGILTGMEKENGENLDSVFEALGNDADEGLKQDIDIKQRINEQSQISVEQAARVLARLASDEVGLVDDLLKASSLDAATLVRLQSQIGDARTLVAQGDASMRANSFADALDHYRDAYRIAHTVRIQTQQQINLQVRLQTHSSTHNGEDSGAAITTQSTVREREQERSAGEGDGLKEDRPDDIEGHMQMHFDAGSASTSIDAEIRGNTHR